MARIPMVTRTIKTTKVNVLCLNIETAEPTNKVFTLAGTFKNQKQLMKAVETEMKDKLEKAVHVVDIEELETLYGMTEKDFIHNAEVLPARDVKSDEAVDPEEN